MASDFSGFLEDNPSILTEALRPRQTSPGFGSSFLDYWQGRHGNVWNDYLGSIGRSALSGEEPTQSFTDFAGNYNWMDYWRQLSPTQRGTQRSPSLRWFV
jgi:hypothetical protein